MGGHTLDAMLVVVLCLRSDCDIAGSRLGDIPRQRRLSQLKLRCTLTKTNLKTDMS